MGYAGGMEVEYDPTDRGLPWLPPDDEGVETVPRPRPPVDPGPSGPPASREAIAAARALAGLPRSRDSWRLMRPCGACFAGPSRWCKGRVGFLHPERGNDVPERRAG